MTDRRHVYLNDRWYRLAEDAEGRHYKHRREPLRVPNSQVVQGAEKFQLRPDLVQWNITNWTEGEGQIKWDGEMSGRSYLISNLDPFTQAGNLRLGPLMSALPDNGGVSTYDAEDLVFAPGRNNGLYGISRFPAGNAFIYWFDYSVPKINTGVDTGVAVDVFDACGNAEALYFVDKTGDVYTYDSGGTSLHNDQCSITTGFPNIVVLGDYLYVYDPAAGVVYEISAATPNTASAETALYDFSPSGGSTMNTNQQMIAGDNRVYVMQTMRHETLIHEIVPTTAAYTGYGRIIATLRGVTGEAIDWFNGYVVLYTKDEGYNGDLFSIFYLDPEGNLGTFGQVRTNLGSGPPADQEFKAGQGRLDHLSFVGPDFDDADNGPALFLLDAITGGFAQISSAADQLANTGQGLQALYDKGQWVIPTVGTSHDYVFGTSKDEYMASGYAISPHNDFQLADEKLLREITLTCEPLPANTSIQVLYDLGDGSFTSAGTYSTTGGEGTTFTVSTDSTTRTFRHLRIKVVLATTTSTSTPILRSLEVRASVVKYINVWELLIDLTDDHPQSGRSGANDAAALAALAENTVYAFKDGYMSHVDGSETEYDVEMDSVDIDLSQPGEGIAQLVLRET